MSQPAFERLDAWRIRIPKDAARGMRTDVVAYASDPILEQIRKDLSLEQAMNVATLPGIVGPALTMPDIHQGYGFPIGGVAACDWRHGVVSPGGVGFDINCGVRLMSTSLHEADVRPRLAETVDHIFRNVPCGTGGKGPYHIGQKDLEQVLLKGSRWMVEQGYGEERDVHFTEEEGCLADADPSEVSERAKLRGLPQLGTIGSGNHFLEIQYVESIHDGAAAQAMGIEPGRIVILLHCGSRGLGHQVCTDFLAGMGAAMQRHHISVPDRQLACVPIQSEEGQSYLKAMRAAANFAWANRQGILHLLRQSLRAVYGDSTWTRVLYDVCHNIAKREKYIVDGVKRDVLVHRKGATRAFPPGHPEIPMEYRHIGQPVLVPGSMGTASWILVGQQKSMEESFGSVCHGAGRLLSRTAAKKGRNARQVQDELAARGIIVRSETRDGILEEIPEAYKDVDEVIAVVEGAGLAKRVARLRPMGVIKG
ncbi:MAG: RtcB family protein [Bryobacteraceae bacterium]|nr:RtcB family protein [Bryobacteraceae bacterium]